MSRGRARSRRRFGAALVTWLEQHGSTAAAALGRLRRTPVAAGMTLGTIAIALALPAMLHLVLVNLEHLTGDWERSAAISLFLEPGVGEERAAAIARQLHRRGDIVRVELIGRDQGLAEFRNYSGLAGALDQLDDNPLPVVLVLYPTADRLDEDSLEALAAAAEAIGGADFARLDARWLQRLEGILALLRTLVLVLAAALGFAVLLVVGNTIRLEIENRREEIRIMDLVGATTAFIRRPFLYSGTWYGLLGGLLAWLLVAAAVAAIQGRVRHLAILYDSDFTVAGPGGAAALLLPAAGALLGILGSWLAVGRHLRGIAPS